MFKQVNIINKIPNYPIDLNGLTGCLSFIEVNFDNVEINSTNSIISNSLIIYDLSVYYYLFKYYFKPFLLMYAING